MRPGLRVTLLAAAACAACGPHVPQDVVLWIEVDTLRADALGCYGNDVRGEGGIGPSPNIDALAAEGVRFEHAYSVAPWTVPSLVSQFTGLWPWEHGAVRVMEPVGESGETVAARFRAAGYRTAGVSTNFIVRGELGFARGFERWDDSLATGHTGSTSSAAVARLLELADELRGEGDDLFLFVLLFEPHYRYEDEPGLRFGPGVGDAAAYAGALTGDEPLPELRKRRASLTDEDVAFLRGRYQSEVARVDRAVGELMAGIRERGLDATTQVWFTADHGEEIMDRGWIGHTRTLHEELVRVPLVVRPRPAEHGSVERVVTQPVSLVDLAATIVDDAGAEPGRLGGRSFAATYGGSTRIAPPRRFLYLHSDFEPPLRNEDTAEKVTHLWGVVDGETRLKWIVDRKAEEPVGQLFDLASDPGETRDLAGEREVPAQLLRLDGLDPASASATGRELLEEAGP